MIYTYEEIAEDMGMTRSGVRKLEQRALRKVKKALDKRGMTLDDILPTETHFEPEQTPWDTAE
jgi:DNA-directed RNA polymerase sigma subunit (sigma70/sigma32)